MQKKLQPSLTVNINKYRNAALLPQGWDRQFLSFYTTASLLEKEQSVPLEVIAKLQNFWVCFRPIGTFDLYFVGCARPAL
jgi:hypothetical protein